MLTFPVWSDTPSASSGQRLSDAFFDFDFAFDFAFDVDREGRVFEQRRKVPQKTNSA